MGLCFSINRDHYRLSRINMEETKRRTFNEKFRLAKIKSIYDGDTFTIITRLHRGEPYEEYSIRLLGFDAPEVKPVMTTPNRELHKQAGLHLRDLLRERFQPGTIVAVEFTKEEKYGRLLGEIFTVQRNWYFKYVKGVSIGASLVLHGLVLPYGGQTKSDFNEGMLHHILNTNELHL